MADRARIAHLSGPASTIQNTPALVTSNKARAAHGLPPLAVRDGAPAGFDALRPQRLAAPAKVYVEQFSAHPMERDAAELYGPPDGYVDSSGRFHAQRQSEADKPVYAIELRPDDGLYPLPYMARQADGTAWEQECAFPNAPAARARQTFLPDGSRLFEEIDRLGIGPDGAANLASSQAQVDFFRVLPPAGYSKGLPADRRTDVGAGDVAPEARGRDYFAYSPYHLSMLAPRQALARAANTTQSILASGQYDGAIWTEGSPTIEETIYWLNLLVDTTVPICGNAAQRAHGQIGSDGPKNLLDSLEYISSRVWADERGFNRAGAVLVQEQQIFSARTVQKADARPGGYLATGAHGGILGASGYGGPPTLHFVPTTQHTFRSDVNLSRLPEAVTGVTRRENRLVSVPVLIKTPGGQLIESAIPRVSIVKEGSYVSDGDSADSNKEVDLIAMIDDKLSRASLAGFVVEGLAPYGLMTSGTRTGLMRRAQNSGLPVVYVGRGNADGMVPMRPGAITGSNLTATKARILLIACLLKIGSIPPAKDPDAPTSAETAAIDKKVAEYQRLFDTH